MEAKEYIKKFKMNQQNFEFSRPEFIACFKLDFLESLINNPNRDPESRKLRYKYFKETVRNFEIKFWEISRLRKGRGLTLGLWQSFFKGVVVPYRSENYPIVQGHIEKIRGSRPLKSLESY